MHVSSIWGQLKQHLRGAMGATGSHVTGRGPDRMYALRMPGFFPRFVSYNSSSTSTMATGSDPRSRDPFGVRIRSRNWRNIQPIGAF